MDKIDFNEWEEITKEEYTEIGNEDVMWIMFHKGSDYKAGYYFKKRIGIIRKNTIKENGKKL